MRAYDVSPQFLEVCQARCQESINQGRLRLHLLDLTSADRRMYAGQAEAQQAKGFQRVDVSFDAPDGDSVSRVGDGGPAGTNHEMGERL